MCGVVKPLRAESANASPNCLLSIRSAGLAWTQHGNPEANIARCSREDRRRPSHQSDRRSNAMATIKRTLIQLLSSDAYARGATYPSGWHRLVGPAGVSGGHLGWNADRGAHAALPWAGCWPARRGRSAIRVVQHARFRMAIVSPRASRPDRSGEVPHRPAHPIQRPD